MYFWWRYNFCATNHNPFFKVTIAVLILLWNKRGFYSLCKVIVEVHTRFSFWLFVVWKKMLWWLWRSGCDLYRWVRHAPKGDYLEIRNSFRCFSVCLFFDNRSCMLNMWLMNYPWYSGLQLILTGLTCLWNTCLCLLILLPCNGEFLNCKFADTVTIDFCYWARLFELCNLFQIMKYRYGEISKMQIGNDIKVPFLFLL